MKKAIAALQEDHDMRDSVANSPVDLTQPSGGQSHLRSAPRARQNGNGNLLEREFMNDKTPRAPHASIAVNAM